MEAHHSVVMLGLQKSFWEIVATTTTETLAVHFLSYSYYFLTVAIL